MGSVRGQVGSGMEGYGAERGRVGGVLRGEYVGIWVGQDGEKGCGKGRAREGERGVERGK